MKNSLCAIAALFVGITLSSCYTSRTVSQSAQSTVQQSQPIMYGYDQPQTQYVEDGGRHAYNQPVYQDRVIQNTSAYNNAPVQQYRQPSTGAIILGAVVQGAVHGLIDGLLQVPNRYYSYGRYRYPIYTRSYRGIQEYYYYNNEYSCPLYPWPNDQFDVRPYNGPHSYYDERYQQQIPAGFQIQGTKNVIFDSLRN